MRKTQKNKNKIIRLSSDPEQIKIEDKIPLAKCREILKKRNVNYTDEQILLIRDWFYELAAITYDEYFNQKQTIVIPLTGNQNNDYEESHYLRAS